MGIHLMLMEGLIDGVLNELDFKGELAELTQVEESRLLNCVCFIGYLLLILSLIIIKY